LTVLCQQTGFGRRQTPRNGAAETAELTYQF